MGLLLDQVLPNGFTATYFKIVEFTADFIRNSAKVTLALYKDQATADGGGTPIDYFGFNLSDQDFPFDPNTLATLDPVGLAYGAVKLLPTFTTAQDVIEAQPLLQSVAP